MFHVNSPVRDEADTSALAHREGLLHVRPSWVESKAVASDPALSQSNYHGGMQRKPLMLRGLLLEQAD